jgi:hypothetical protein
MNFVKIFADKNFLTETYLINCLIAGWTHCNEEVKRG